MSAKVCVFARRTEDICKYKLGKVISFESQFVNSSAVQLNEKGNAASFAPRSLTLGHQFQLPVTLRIKHFHLGPLTQVIVYFVGSQADKRIND